jgi:hypothetical protein
MSTISQAFQKERSLQGAPRVHTVSPEYAAAAELALAHARLRLRLPAGIPIVWVSKPGGNSGETWWYHDGRLEVLLNTGADLSPREVARVLLHELKHVADGQHHRMSYWDAEDGANRFAGDVMDERQTQDFFRLDWRRPSGRR